MSPIRPWDLAAIVVLGFLLALLWSWSWIALLVACLLVVVMACNVSLAYERAHERALIALGEAAER